MKARDLVDTAKALAADVLTSPSQRARRTCGMVGLDRAAQVSDRADRLIARLRSPDGTVVLFSHGPFGSVLAARWIEGPLIEAQHLRLDTASHGVLGSDPHHPEVPIIASWNTTGEETVGSPGGRHGRSAAAMQQKAIARWENEGGESPT